MKAYFGDDPAEALPTAIFYAGWNAAEAEDVVKAKFLAEELTLATMDWEDERG
jgi:hypothetical protein